MLSLTMLNVENNEVFEYIVYIEDKQVINQIRTMTISEYQTEIQENKTIIKTENSKNG